MTRDEAIKYVIGHWPKRVFFPLSEWNLTGDAGKYALSMAFIWEDTLEGRDFWLKLSEIIDGEQESEPELVLPSIDWSAIKPEYKWLAQDEEGGLFVYKNCPESGENQWYSDTNDFAGVNALSAKPGTGDWTKLIVERPEPLWYPDDSGEWVEFSSPGKRPVDAEVVLEALLARERASQDYDAFEDSALFWCWNKRVDDEYRIVAYKVVKDD